MNEVIWEGLVGLSNWKARVHIIAEHVTTRGVLKIYSLEEELLYQKEVPIDLSQKYGGTAKDFQEWNKIIRTWVVNSSPHRPRSIYPPTPEA